MDGDPNNGGVSRIEQVVTSAGDSWIICRSKSHYGRVYYFNTLTGQAAWNLSEAEVQKAKSWTKNLASNIVPKEPTDPPMDSARDEQSNETSITRKDSTSSTIYNKQVINNQYPRQPFPVPPFIMPPCNQVVSNAALVPFGVNAFNNSVWAIPTPQQFFITPPSLLHRTETAANAAYNNDHPSILVQNTSTSLSERFQRFQIEQNSNLSQRNFHRGNITRYNRGNITRYNRGIQKKDNHRYSKKYLRDNDLRKLLSAKKNKLLEKSLNRISQVTDIKDESLVTKSCINTSDNEDSSSQSVLTDTEIEADSRSYHEKELPKGRDTHKELHVDTDSDWLEENIIVQGSQLKLDLTNVKKLAKPGVDANCWFIVTDEDILLNHLNFLNTFSNSDELCQLMVPQPVMLKMRELAFSGINNRTTNRARRGLAFIQQLLEFNYVMIGEGISETDSSYLLDCCLNLSRHNYHVILLSNNQEVKSHVNGTQIPIFTIAEMKQFLTKPTLESNTEKPLLRVNSPKKPIKITVPNEFSRKPEQDATNRASNNTLSNIEPVVQSNNVQLTDNEIPDTKKVNAAPVTRTIDTGTQSEPDETIAPSILTRNIRTSPRASQEYSNIGKKSDLSIKSAKSAITTSPPVKRREIRLNRSISNKSSLNSDDTDRDKKQFKWRKKRTTNNKQVTEPLPASNRKINNENASHTQIKNDRILTYSNQLNKNQSHDQFNIAFDKEINNEPTQAQIKNNEMVTHATQLNKTQSCYQFNTAFGKEVHQERAPAQIKNNKMLTYANQLNKNQARDQLNTEFDKEVNQESTQAQIKNNKMLTQATQLNDHSRNQFVAAFTKKVNQEPTQTQIKNDIVLTYTNKLNENQPRDQNNKAFCKQVYKEPFQNNNNMVVYAENFDESQLCYQSNDYFSKQVNNVINDDNTEGSETSSLAMLRNTTNERIIIDETSTSGIVSNSTSYVDSESDRKLTGMINQSNAKELDVNLMFVIKDQNMEDYLRMRSDEWVSRFLQVMEEVLTQVLRKDEDFLVNVVYKLHGGGPWTIREATDCVKRKFSNNSDIIDAANMLENIFSKISDDSGRIKMNLKPSEYMEMYSYGVCLVETLQVVLSDCEDLQAAAQSLNKLLCDIQNPNVESHHETFEDNQEPLENISQIPEITEETVQSSLHEKQHNNSPQKSSNRAKDKKILQENNQSRYNLRCKDKKQLQENNQSLESAKISKQNDIKNSFLSNLNLQKKASDQNEKPNLSNPKSVTKDTVQISQDFVCNFDSSEVNKETNDTSNLIQTKIVRKFTLYPDYEKKLASLERQTLDLDALDYTATIDDGEYLDGDYYSDHELQTEDNEIDPNEEIGDFKTFRESPVLINEGDETSLKPSPVDLNDKINRVLSKVLQKIKRRILDVHLFCVDARNELQSSEWTSKRKLEMHDLANKLKVQIVNLCKLLNRLYCRETYEPENNIQSLLRSAGINDQELDHNQLHAYRDDVGKCLQQARILQDSIILIMTVVKDKPVNAS